jgi:hypothetical protein
MIAKIESYDAAKQRECYACAQACLRKDEWGLDNGAIKSLYMANTRPGKNVDSKRNIDTIIFMSNSIGPKLNKGF